MFFTQEDYKKVQNWLLQHTETIKDTEFEEGSSLNGKEFLVIVQNGRNMRISLEAFMGFIKEFDIPYFYNVTEECKARNISLLEASNSIPFELRKMGQVITFIDEDDEWKVYQFRGEAVNQWNILSLWVDLVKEFTGEIVTDEEDLTIVKEGSNKVIKFKNKVYNPSNYSGKGRIYLRKNIVEIEDAVTKNIRVCNLLTQDMIGSDNTIYVIQYDYDLNHQTIIIPEGCILKFEGGSFTNGTITELRPTNVHRGFQYFDASLNKPIWWDGSKWVDASGNNV